MTKDEALDLALEALENHEGNYKLSDAGCDRHNKAITACQQALAAAQRPWVGLTDEERGKVYADWRWSDGRTSNLALCEAIEAKLKEKMSHL